MAIPILQAEQYQFLDTGIKLNAGAAVPFVDLDIVDGLDSAPVRQQTVAFEGADGGWIDASYQDMRTVSLEGRIYASPTALETYLDQLKANFTRNLTPQPLYFGTDAGMRMVLAKCLGLRASKSRLRSMGVVEFQVQFICEDPRIYTPTLVSVNLPGTLTLNGNRDSVGTITINGARTNPSITLGATTFTFDYTLTDGNSIVIDLRDRTVILNGTTNLRGKMTVTGPWPKLVPGNNVFTVGGTGAGTITVSARSAWE